MMNLDDFRNAAAKLAAKTSKIAAELQAKERADIAGAITEKSHLADGYWKLRRDAEQ
jgi:hypothetical protein